LQTQERTMGRWAEDLWQTLESFALEKLILQQSADSLELELAALNNIYTGLQHIRQLNRLMLEKRKRSDFYYLLQQNVFPMQIRLTGQPFSGVQVMGLLEARSLPAKVLILLGNIEGCFPASLHRELFVPEPFRNELGLTTHKKLERLQDQQFFALITSFSCSHLFYCTQDEDRPAVKSRYLQLMELLNALQPGIVRTIEEDGLLFPGDFLSSIDLQIAPTSLQVLYENLQQQCTARRNVRGDFQDDRAPLFSAMSPSSMEHLLFCPYRYLLHKLQFSEMDLPDDDMDSREAGQWLHRVCECFFKGMDSPPTHWPELREPWHELVNEDNYARALIRLQRLSRALMDQNRSRLDYLYQMHYIGWHKFLDREMQRTVVSLPDSKYEFRLQHAEKNILNIADLAIMISGRVDRIATGDEEIRIIDYKTRKNWPSKKQVAAGKAPQLPLYVEMLRRQKEYQEAAKWSAEYFALWDGETTELQEHAPKLELSESWRNLTDNLENRLKTLLVQKKPMQPEEDKEVCKYCDYAGICRRQEEGI
ncbi:MAG: PD-(D/E)XK nuclease family protein, partial [bacterium]